MVILRGELIASWTVSPRQKRVAKQSGLLLLEEPRAAVRPEPRKLRACKAGAHADHGVVPGDPIAANQSEQPAGVQCQHCPPRFTRDEERTSSRDELKQPFEFVSREMVE